MVVFSSMSAAGTRLNNLTGIAAILRFNLPQLDDMVEADEGDLDSDEESFGRSSGQKESDDAMIEESKDSEEQELKESEPGFLDDVYGLMGGFDG